MTRRYRKKTEKEQKEGSYRSNLVFNKGIKARPRTRSEKFKISQ